jgi:hypothetical protein
MTWPSTGFVTATTIGFQLSSSLARIWDGRTAISSENPLNFFGTGLGAKIFRRRNSHINLLKIGDMVWLRMSPINGMAGGDKSNTSARAVG